MGKIYVLPDQEIERLLHTALVGRIACCAAEADGEARPYLVPLAYAYDGEGIYSISGPGRKIQIMRAQPKVAFEVDEAFAEDRWSSVIADGEYEELTVEADREYARRLIHRDHPDAPQLLEGQIASRLRLTRKTGRFELPDHEDPPAGTKLPGRP